MGCFSEKIGIMNKANLNDLRAVIAIAKRKSFRGAAIELNMSSTALSHAINKLEESMGVRLFNRTTRSVSLTEAGQLFVSQVGPALIDIQDALEVVRSQRQRPAGVIRINSASFAATEIFSPLVIQFLKRYPEMQVDFVTDNKLIDIAAEGFDFGIRAHHLIPSDMIAVPLTQQIKSVVVATPKYIEQNGKPRLPIDLLKHQCICIRLPDGSVFKWKFEQNNEVTLIDVMGQITVDDANMAKIAVLEHMGFAYFMQQHVVNEMEEGRLIPVLQDWLPVGTGLSLYYTNRKNPSAGINAFLAMAREMYNNSEGKLS